MESIFFKECEIPQYLTMYQFHHLSQFPLSPCRLSTWIRRLGTNSTNVSKAFCQHVRPSPKRIRTGEIDSSSHGWKVFQGTDVWSSQSSMNLKVSCQGLWRVWEICIQIYTVYIYKNQIVCLKKKDRKSKKFVSHWKSDDGWLNADWKPIAGPSKLIIVLHWSIYMDQFVGRWFFSGGTTWACSFFVALPIWWNLMSNWVQYVRNCILHPKKTHFQHNLQVSCKQMATSTFRWKL